MSDAIQDYRPDLIVPCDDRVVGHLCALFERAAEGPRTRGAVDVRRLIETSLGLQTARGRVSKRSLLAELSGLADVHVPQIDTIESLVDLRAWVARNGLPAVLKLDGSWGGQDVILMRTEAQIARAFFEIRFRRSSLMRLKRMLFNGDVEALVTGATGAQICVQAFVPGRLANTAMVCWQGEVLATVAVEVVRTQKLFGRATIVRQVGGEQMVAAGCAIAQHLELSGLYGLDFVLNEVSGAASLLEINPRATQVHHLSAGPGVDLPAVMFGALTGAAVETSHIAPVLREIALFPNQLGGPTRDYLSNTFQDVPYEEPELAKYYGYQARSSPRFAGKVVKGSGSALD